MSRKITGHVAWRGGRWQVLATGPHGKRDWYDLPGSIPREDRETAERVGALVAQRIRRGEALPEERGETVGEYLERWDAGRSKRGITSQAGHLRAHLLRFPGVASMSMVSVDKPLMEDFVDWLDKKVEKREVRRWRTVHHVWKQTNVLFHDAVGAKDRTFRVTGMKGNPCVGVSAPDKHRPTALQWLYPSEFMRLVSCEQIEREHRRLYAWTTYALLRRGEALAIDLSRDLDVEHFTFYVHQAHSATLRDVDDSVKNEVPLHVSIHPRLRPLALTMHREGLSQPFSWAIPLIKRDKGLAEMLRRDLITAGVTRRELHESPHGSAALRFHDLRATGATWLRMEDYTMEQVAQRLRDTVTVAQGYVRPFDGPAAMRGDYGRPFPTLPSSLGIDPCDLSTSVAGDTEQALRRASEAGRWDEVQRLASLLRTSSGPRGAAEDLGEGHPSPPPR